MEITNSFWQANYDADRRRYNRGTRGNRGGGRKHARRTLLIDGVVQDGHYTVVSIDRNTIVLQSATTE